MKKIVAAGLSSVFCGMFLLGCAQNQPTPPKVITKKIIYIPSQDEKKAIAILIYKQNQLEKEINNLKANKQIKTNVKKEIKTTHCRFVKKNKEKECSTKIDKNSFYTAIRDVNIRECGTIYSPIVGIVKRGEMVKFDYCNKYCWCLLKNKKGYVYRKLFVKVIKEKKNTNSLAILNNTNSKQLKKSNKIKATAKNIDNNVKKKQNGNKLNKPKKVINVDEVIKNYINSNGK